tara:strand:- start:586 stop:744 length:159 start_codon:yes stop_codon:yes gene_type:complete
MPPPKKNKFQKTNKKPVEKLGKGKKAPANAIQTSFQSKGKNVEGNSPQLPQS